MEQLFTLLGQTLGITVIHSLWQGLVIWLALRLMYVIYPSLASTKKYRLSFIALLAMVCWFMYTCYTESRVLADLAAGIPAHAMGVLQGSTVKGAHISPSVNVFSDNTFLVLSKRYLPLIAVLYIGGLLFHLFKLGIAFKNIKLIRREFIADEYLQQRVDTCSSLLPTGRSVVAGFTRLINTPCVVGYFKPLILLPFSLANQLGEAEVEAILLHELAHIQAGDYLQNGIQQACEALLFFNPFARFIGQMVSNERENRCDDLVIGITGDRLTYAKAILKLEENRADDFSLALAAVGTRYPQLNRIERIMEPATIRINTRYLTGILLVLFCGLGSIIWLKADVPAKPQAAKLNFKNIGRKLTPQLSVTPQPKTHASINKTNKLVAPVLQTIPQKTEIETATNNNLTSDIAINNTTTSGAVINNIKTLDVAANNTKTVASEASHPSLYDGPAWRNYIKQKNYYVSLPRTRPKGLSDEEWNQRGQEHKRAIMDNYHEVTVTEAWKKYPLELAQAKTARETDEVKARLFTSDAWINYALGIFKADAKLYEAPKK
jgi:beta-lactamase regulating signal transducer with metallopeptidase domain